MQSERLFKEAPVWQAIGALVGPSVLSVLVMVIYNMTDLFFIGLLKDTAQTAAVAVVGPVFTLASAGATVLGMGGWPILWVPVTARMPAASPVFAAGVPC